MEQTMTHHSELRRLAKAATPGPWRVQTGCSWRRIGTDSGDGDVLRPCTHPHDGWPDIVAPAENLKYIASANPKTILALLDEIDQIKAENEALREALFQISSASCSDARSVVIARTALTKGATQ